jgi:hypothetical protein
MKSIVSILILMILMVSCQENNDHSFDSEKESVTDVLEKFPMIDKNLKSVRKIDLDSLSITLLRNPNKRAYDEILVFEKKNRFYAIPFLSNMYSDYWNFQNDKQAKLFPKTNSTFEKELSDLIINLNLTGSEFGLFFDELMLSTLNTESDLYNKLSFFQNATYMSTRVDKYKTEESDSCKKRTNLLFNQMSKDYNNKQIKIFRYFWDKGNGRVYKFENTAKDFNEIKFNFKTYRIDCYVYPSTY